MIFWLFYKQSLAIARTRATTIAISSARTVARTRVIARAITIAIARAITIAIARAITIARATAIAIARATARAITLPGLNPHINYRVRIIHPGGQDPQPGQSPLAWDRQESVLNGHILSTIGLRPPVQYPQQATIIEALHTI